MTEENVIDVKPATKRVAKKTTKTVSKTPRARKATPAPESAMSGYEISFAVIPNSETVVLTDKMEIENSLITLKGAIVSIVNPPRQFGPSAFTKTANNVKLMENLGAARKISFKVRDTYSDNLVNAIDVIANIQDVCNIVCIVTKTDRAGKVCLTNIYSNVKFETLTNLDGISFERNAINYASLVCKFGMLYEATTRDLQDIVKFLTEKFSS